MFIYGHYLSIIQNSLNRVAQTACTLIRYTERLGESARWTRPCYKIAIHDGSLRSAWLSLISSPHCYPLLCILSRLYYIIAKQVVLVY